MKHFVIRCCYECPFLIHRKEEGFLFCAEKWTDDHCEYPEEIYEIEDGTELPGWCPLEDYHE